MIAVDAVWLLDWNQMVILDFLIQIRWLDKVCTAVRQQAETFQERLGSSDLQTWSAVSCNVTSLKLVISGGIKIAFDYHKH